MDRAVRRVRATWPTGLAATTSFAGRGGHPAHGVERPCAARPSRPRAAVRNVGAAARQPLRPGRAVAGRADDRRAGGDRPPRPALPRRVRAGQPGGCRELDRAPGTSAEAGPRCAGPATVPRCGRARVDRPARCAAARRGRPGTRPLSPDLGRQPAGPCAADRDPARAVPPTDLQHEDAALLPDLPGRRRGRRDVAVRGRSRVAGPVRSTSGAVAPCGRRRRPIGSRRGTPRRAHDGRSGARASRRTARASPRSSSSSTWCSCSR